MSKTEDKKVTLIDPNSPLFKCHGQVFNNRADYDKHMSTVDHAHGGFTLCSDCGKKEIPVTWSGQLQPGLTPSAYCDDCLLQHAAELKARGLIKQ